MDILVTNSRTNLERDLYPRGEKFSARATNRTSPWVFATPWEMRVRAMLQIENFDRSHFSERNLGTFRATKRPVRFTHYSRTRGRIEYNFQTPTHAYTYTYTHTRGRRARQQLQTMRLIVTSCTWYFFFFFSRIYIIIERLAFLLIFRFFFNALDYLDERRRYTGRSNCALYFFFMLTRHSRTAAPARFRRGVLTWLVRRHRCGYLKNRLLKNTIFFQT